MCTEVEAGFLRPAMAPELIGEAAVERRLVED